MVETETYTNRKGKPSFSYNQIYHSKVKKGSVVFSFQVARPLAHRLRHALDVPATGGHRAKS